MRFKIDFSLAGEPPYSLPVNYQSEFATWVYKMLHYQSDDFTRWLKKKNYLDDSGQYRLFTFSELNFPAFSHNKERLIIETNQASIILSFYADADIEPFVYKVFEGQEFKLGDKGGKVAFYVEKLHKIDQPDFEKSKSVVFSCLSPMLMAEPGKNDGPYATPDHKEFDKIFFKNLMFKYANLVKFMPSNKGDGLANLQDLKFKLIGKPKSRIIRIKTDTPHQKAVKGYMFDFELKAPAPLLSIGYDAGFGELNNLGFGCCKIKE